MNLDWEKNLGTTDRIIRIAFGATLLALVMTKSVAGWWVTGAVVLAIFQFIEAFFAY
ncbi:DUF2892 domain-containing protein [Anaeroselena agilis]|uniref:DUF2892 domain-containing protein n=1 Tax=Anaeroselena agilis TaxID=3063788 RepID=A0ABU3NTJ0_9FIRM|nr:DUF2892 domain-containing protein [Selenomonadales bacterium 4137-cl]